jgi:predicted P-loop ATPase
MDDRGRCTCPVDGCTRGGYHPRPGRVPLPGSGYGIRTGIAGPHGSGIFVIDLDVKNGKDGVTNFVKMAELAGAADLPETLLVETGGGGKHLYLQHPGHLVSSTANVFGPGYEGIDVRGDARDGAWVVGPGSTHASGHLYRVLVDAPIARAPAWLLDWPHHDQSRHPGAALTRLADAVERIAEGAQHVREVDPLSERGQQAIEEFRIEARGQGTHRIEFSVQGSNGSAKLVHVARRGHQHYRLPFEVVCEVVSSEFSPRCSPPWSETEIVHCVRNRVEEGTLELDFGPVPKTWGDRLVKLATLQGTKPGAGQDPVEREEIARAIDEAPEPRTDDPDHTYDVVAGRDAVNGDMTSAPLGTLAFILSTSPQWRGVLQWDEMRDNVLAVNPPTPLDAERQSAGLTDADVGRVKIWFEVVHSISPDRGLMREACDIAAKMHPFHPVGRYFETLPPGDVTILDDLATRFFGDTSPLANRLVKMFLVGAVRRVLTPGCKMDTILVLFDPRGGTGKTEFVDALFGEENVAHQMPPLDSVDANAMVAQHACVEYGELAAMVRAGIETVNNFLTLKWDVYRPKYGRTIIHKARASVGIATTNRLEFIRDLAGARRLWPILVPEGRPPSFALVKAIRDDVWAAAVTLALDDSFLHYIPTGSEFDDELQAAQLAHLEFDPNHEAVVAYCKGRETVTAREVFDALDGEGMMTKAAEQEIGRTLRNIGATKDREYDPIIKQQRRFWKMPEVIAKMDRKKVRPFQILKGGKE